ncbi:hypothetical protein ANCDUO_26393, partial [Ancylostoma duodenale]
NHKNGPGRCCLCHKMRTAAVQQGLVHKDPDVDALYRRKQDRPGQSRLLEHTIGDSALVSGYYMLTKEKVLTRGSTNLHLP